MQGKHYQFEKGWARFWVGATAGVLGTAALSAALQGRFADASLAGVVLLAYTALWIWRGIRGCVLAEVTESELIFRDPGYIPTRVTRYRLSDLSGIEVVGPRRARILRITHQNGTVERVVWTLGTVLTSRRVPEFLTAHLPAEIPVTHRDPPTWFEEVRGNY